MENGGTPRPPLSPGPRSPGEVPQLLQPKISNLDLETVEDASNGLSLRPLGEPEAVSLTLGTITQQDVVARMPVETEAETSILNSLDRRDPTSMSPKSQPSWVLPGVLDQDLKALRTDSKAVASMSTRNVKPHHRRKTSLGDQLQGLTLAMDAVHMEHLALIDDDQQDLVPTVELSNEPSSANIVPPNSAADTFGHNTNILLERHVKKRSDDDSSIERAASSRPHEIAEIGTKPGVTAEKRWKMLKHAVVASSIAGNPKKVVVEIPVATDDKKNEERNDSDSDDVDNFTERTWKRNKARKVFRDIQAVVSPQQFSTYGFFKIGLLFILLPCTGVAFILFYLAGNPPTGILDLDRSKEEGILINKDGDEIRGDIASASWWLLFVGVRHISLLLLAKFLEVLFIDILSVRTKCSLRLLGPWATLFMLQTKGWPFLSFTWGLLSIGLLTGTRDFAHHWAYWQDYIDLFNESNPSGNIVTEELYYRICVVAVAVGLIVSCKRFWLGMYLGRQTFTQFSARLTAVMKQILLVSEVASLGRAFERYVRIHKDEKRNVSVTNYGVKTEDLRGMIGSAAPGAEDPLSPFEALERATAKFVVDPTDRHPITGQLSEAQKARINSLLDQWAEPTLAETAETMPTVNELLQFRRALEYLKTPYPFSGGFGLADTRESTIESSQKCYKRLLLRSANPEVLTFDIVALLAVQSNGQLDAEKIKELIKVFKPDRDGHMECVEFVKCIDEVYKDLRLLRASVANSSKIDRAFESIFNFVFYAILGCLILSQLGYDPLALFLSISGVILAFAFMIGSASSKYFEGLLFIVVRRPFQIGDGIAFSGVNDSVPSTGSPMWIVSDVDLFTTTLVFSFTGEKATVSNGSLASSRCINSSISKEASLYVLIKFPIEVSYEKLAAFKEQLAVYFKNRPREWLAFTRFRPTRFEIDAGFSEYIICAQHRLGWDKYGDLQQSKADLMHFCMELQKRMDLLYKRPPQPVDVNLDSNTIGGAWAPDSNMAPPSPLPAAGSRGGGGTTLATDYASLQALFSPKTD